MFGGFELSNWLAGCVASLHTAPTTKTMSIFKVAITQKPSQLEEQAGVVEEMVLPTTEVLANTKEQAIALVVFQNYDKLKADTSHDLKRATVLICSSF